jgi:hypothetical protein
MLVTKPLYLNKCPNVMDKRIKLNIKWMLQENIKGDTIQNKEVEDNTYKPLKNRRN